MGSTRVLIVSASMGAGHDAVARALSRRLWAHGIEPEILDVLALPRWRQGDVLRGFYRGMVRFAPAVYGFVMEQWMRRPEFFERVVAAGSGDYTKPLLDAVRWCRADLVVSTYNLASQHLGRLRSAGELRVPVVTYVPDPGAHPYWVSAGVDVHLATLPQTARGLERFGAADVRVVAPLVEVVTEPEDRRVARERWRLPEADRVVLVNGGSWGVGGVRRTAALLARADGMTPAVLCGRSSSLHRQISRVPGAVAVPWTDDVSGLLAAADVVVDNAGGISCWEALAAGRPVVMHRPLPGHGRLNAATLVEAGLVTRADDVDGLVSAVSAACPTPEAETVLAGPDAVDVMIDACLQPRGR
jgi:processive 1,2-diacylglycerol beta-glucosyltransferase